LRQVGFEIGGETGKRLASIFGIATSSDQILRLIRMSGEPVIPNLKVVGIDDWAWLKNHPEIEFVSRDRGQDYIEGISQELPDAIQIADRFHLLRNLLETLQKMLEPEHEALKLANQQIRFDEVKALQLEGLTQREIARRMDIARPTVCKYFRLKSLPNRKDRVLSTSKTVPYQHHLSKRLRDGCQDLTQLYDELRQMGFDGSYSSVSRAVHRLGVGNLKSASHSTLPPIPHFSPKQAAWALFQPEYLLKEPLLSFQNSLCNISVNASKSQNLAQTFRELIRNRQADKLDAWLINAEQSAIPEFIRLVASFQSDYAAVKMGVHSPWSNGQVEGQNNRLKLIKRQMYGRAGFQLLRIRVLDPAPFS
jgi:transposase